MGRHKAHLTVQSGKLPAPIPSATGVPQYPIAKLKPKEFFTVEPKIADKVRSAVQAHRQSKIGKGKAFRVYKASASCAVCVRVK